jgi:hypothetical protein
MYALADGTIDIRTGMDGTLFGMASHYVEAKSKSPDLQYMQSMNFAMDDVLDENIKNLKDTDSAYVPAHVDRLNGIIDFLYGNNTLKFNRNHHG